MKKNFEGKTFAQVSSAIDLAVKALACFKCLKTSCYRKLKDKNATDEDHAKRKALRNSSTYKRKVNGPKVSETKTEE